MKILISGASGFIGGELVEALVNNEHQVYILSRKKEETENTFPYPVKVITWQELSQYPETWDGYIHLAGAGIADKRWTKKRKQELYTSRVDLGKKMVEKALSQERLPDFFFTASAVGIYGNRYNEILNEDSELADGFLADLCKDWEAITKPLEEKGVRSAKIRSGLVLGTSEGALKQLVQLCQMGILSPLGNGRQYMPWIHINDWINACLFLIDNSTINGPVCFSGPKAIEHKKFLQILSEHFDSWLLPKAPATIIRIALGEMSQILLGSQRVEPKKLMDNGFQFQFTTLLEAIEDLYPEPQKGLIFKKKLVLKKKKEDVFPFFAEPKNLEKLTPSFLNFKILDASDEKAKAGTIINYRLKLHGIPIRWKTKILEYVENSHFIDKQEKGPYKKWHHLHQFEDHPLGLLMTDIVRYDVGFGILGKWIAYLYVNKDINKIFDYRTKVLKENFR